MIVVSASDAMILNNMKPKLTRRGCSLRCIIKS
jgi:hypothetical protein